MSPPVRLEKAELHELDAEMKQTINPENSVKLQFNPETLKVSFANQLKTPDGKSSQQFVGSGTTKLALSVYFDVNSPPAQGQPQVDDVRKLTQKVAFFITPRKSGESYIPPALRFVWGSFQFDGIVESLEENLEFFSSEGKPLRASMSLALSQQRIKEFTFRDTGRRPAAGGAAGAGGSAPPGTRPLAAAPAGATLQGLAAQAGIGDDWQAIADANGIENPRRLDPGRLIDLNPAGGTQN